MAEIITGERRAAIDPLKFSQPLGAALVFLGLADSLPIMHGSQGCASFAKALLTRHFNEPIPLQTTAISEVTAVMGSGEAMVATLDAIRKKQRPAIIGLLTTGVTEVSGEDIGGQLRTYLATWADADADTAPLIIGVSTPDFLGGLSDGWSAALEALIRAVVPAPMTAEAGSDAPTALIAASAPPAATLPAAPPAAASSAATMLAGAARAIPAAAPVTTTVPASPLSRRAGTTDEDVADRNLVAVLAGPALTAADLDEVAGLVRAFGLDPVLVPDLSASVDGHLAPAWQPTTTGGAGLAELRSLRRAGAVLVAGATAAPAGELLAARTGARLLHHRHLSGLTETDALVAELMAHTGRTAPEQVRRARARLADGLLDAHFVLGGVRVAIAGEPETLLAAGSLLRDVGAEIVTAVSPTPAPALADAPWAEVVIGDLTEFAERAQAAGAELVLGSSHARGIAERIGAAFLPIGFPIFDRLGTALAGTAGYAGSLRLLLDAANRVLDHGHAHARPGRPPLPASPGSAAAGHRAATEIPQQGRATAEPDELDNLFQESPC
ncbi:Nitrogenase component 1 type Oxidoreductase [Frankia torreyi]|uniref:Nitrogenase component 1 type Oxidoreductase n=1 Tax=Frankia torreyi TaxID=1856 RepID=A0A0D8BGP8_9ACTN|nr:MULTISPECIES: nitrogenase component 1 [Frankia]KJE22622.1 Nitrogenase component 1 type Oxidoreductase [Frankia torreyi]